MPRCAADLADPVFIVHGLAHAVAALKAAAAARRRVVLVSAPGAGGYAGAGWFRALVEAAGEAVAEAEFSAFLDCGDAAGPALAALRTRVGGVIFTGRADVARRLADIARRHGACLLTVRPAAALDLGTDFFSAEVRLIACCAAFLAGSGAAHGEG